MSSSPASSNDHSPSPFFPRSPRLPETSAATAPGLARAGVCCDGDSLGSNKGGRCAPLEVTDGQHMCFFCFKMLPGAV